MRDIETKNAVAIKREKSNYLATYEVRRGGDGKVGIYLRAYNVRCAVFNDNSEALQDALRKLFNDAAKSDA